MLKRGNKPSCKRTRAELPATSRVAEMAGLALVAGLGLLFLTGVALEYRVPSGIVIGCMALLISAGMLAYWWKAYRDRGLKSKPRISFREVYVLYFGMSVEVGFIVHSMLGNFDFGLEIFTLLLPPVLIGIIAAMDDTPYDRGAERRALPRRGVPAKAVAAASSVNPEGSKKLAGG